MSSDSTHWPLLEERAPFAHRARHASPRRLTRGTWLLLGLAFVCGGLVSAAGFSIGWRHQAQRNTAAETALTTATARVRALEASLRDTRRARARERRTAAAALAAEQALVTAGARVGPEATVTSNAAGSVSSAGGSLTAAAARIGSELKTLETYLTTTPASQLDPGYIASQTAYLTRQLTRLQASAGNLGTSIASFEAAARKLTRSAVGLSAH